MQQLKPVFPYARWIVYLDDGTTIVEDRNDPDHWKRIPYERIIHIGFVFDPKPLDKPKLDRNGNPIMKRVKRRYFDKTSKKWIEKPAMKKKLQKTWNPEKLAWDLKPVLDDEGKPILEPVLAPVMEPILDRDTGKQVRVTFPPEILRGSSKFRYRFFMDKIIEQETKPGAEPRFPGFRVGMVVDDYGHCVCLEGRQSRQLIKYYTTVWSLGMDERSLAEDYRIHLKRPEDVVIERGL